MKKIAITGTMASGKSFVVEIIKKLGFTACSSDNLVKEILEKDTIIRSYIFKYDGDIRKKDNTIDKKLLAKYLFQDASFNKNYMKRMYQLLKEKRQDIEQKHNKEKIIFFEIPLLFEAKLETEFDKIILVTANEKDLQERIQQRKFTLGHDVIEEMLERQIPNNEKKELCDHVINTSKDKEQIETEIIEIIEYERNNTRY